MRTIAFISLKGGVAKTTSCLCIGLALADTGQRVRLVDLDPQANLTSALGGVRDDRFAELVGEFIREGQVFDIDDATYNLPPYKADLIPPHRNLASLEPMLSGHTSAVAKQLNVNTDAYDFTLIDCGPTMGNLAVSALIAADEVVIPVEPEYMAVEGLVQVLDTIMAVKSRRNPRLKIAGIIATKVRNLRHHRSILDQIESIAYKYHVPLLYCVPAAVGVAEAIAYGISPMHHKPARKAAEAYDTIAAMLIGGSHE